MGSGKRNYKNRPKKFTLGGFKEDKDKVEPSKEDKEKFIAMWKKLKKRKDEDNT